MPLCGHHRAIGKSEQVVNDLTTFLSRYGLNDMDDLLFEVCRCPEVITPFRNLVLCSDTRREMEDWISALKSAVNKEFYEANAHRDMLSGQHNWYACSHARPTYCNVCREALSGVTSHGLSCEVCKFKAHKRCAIRAGNFCKWTTLASVGVDIIEEEGTLSMPHQWLEGNLPVSAKCSVCDKTCGSVLRHQDWKCLWCKAMAHSQCKELFSKKCPLGQCKVSILPPICVNNTDCDGYFEASKNTRHSPLLVFVNSKSGDNQGVKMLRKFKQILNPAQVFDLINGGPKAGLRLFQRFDQFRILVCGGDGSIGWVLSEIDKAGMHNKCQVGLLPLGTGNDLARVLGWGAAFDDDTQIPTVLEKLEHAQIKMLDRWSIMSYEGPKLAGPRKISQQFDDPITMYEDSVGAHLTKILQSDDSATVISSAKVLCETIKSFVEKVALNKNEEDTEDEGDETISEKCAVLNQKLSMLLQTLDAESEIASVAKQLAAEVSSKRHKEEENHELQLETLQNIPHVQIIIPDITHESHDDAVLPIEPVAITSTTSTSLQVDDTQSSLLIEVPSSMENSVEVDMENSSGVENSQGVESSTEAESSIEVEKSHEVEISTENDKTDFTDIDNEYSTHDNTLTGKENRNCEEKEKDEGVSFDLEEVENDNMGPCPSKSKSARNFHSREKLMSRANSLKKAVRHIIEHTEKAVDDQNEQTQQMQQLGDLMVPSKSPTLSRRPPVSSSSTKNYLTVPGACPGSTSPGFPRSPRLKKGGSSGIGASGGGGGFISKVLLANADALCAAASPLIEDEVALDDYQEKCVMNNYFGIGLDAKITLEFHYKREEHPEKCRSRTRNIMWYGVLGGKEILQRTYKNLEQKVILECDGQRIPLPNLQGLVVLNIPSYMGGTNFWGGKKEDEHFTAPSFDDKILEVVAVFGSVQMAMSRVINIQHHRIAQCRSVTITIIGDEGVPVQVDGEAWVQPPGFIKIVHKNRAQMLTRDRSFEEQLRLWSEKQKFERPTSLQLQTLSDNEAEILQSFVEATTTLITSVKVASISHSAVDNELSHLASETSGYLEKLYPSGRLAENTLRSQVADLVQSVRVLCSETHTFLEQKASNLHLRADLEQKLRESLPIIQRELVRVTDITTNIQSLPLEEEVGTTEHKKRSKFNLMHKLRRKDKDSKDRGFLSQIGIPVTEWGVEEVGMWLEALGLTEYKEAFQQDDIRGAELLQLERRDLKELGVTKVGHLKRIQQGIKDITHTLKSHGDRVVTEKIVTERTTIEKSTVL
ncbi:unnamed protein product [Owenia fusiformis]|uniref:Diacylglycerol kinase n=1 Tax=Owenia fusiformis TaxID=6347 RepID=A0A8S4NIQ1_OWEFU|nr:unnamed protein product [Owenia fusiformis]